MGYPPQRVPAVALHPQIAAEGLDVDAGLAALSQRSGVIDSKVRRRRLVSLTEAGRAQAAGGLGVWE